MQFQCLQHGEVEKFLLDGYGIAHESEMNVHEKDLEGLVFAIYPPDHNDEVTADDIEVVNSEYVDKFDTIFEDLASVVQRLYATRSGVEEFECPHDHGMAIGDTHVVDYIFDIGFSDDIRGSFVLKDNVLTVSIRDCGQYTPSEIVEAVVSEASEDENVTTVKFTNVINLEDFVGPLNESGFETKITEKTYDTGFMGQEKTKKSLRCAVLELE